MATTVTRYVNTGSTAGGDGTTNATAGANRAYATLSEALSANPRDLVAADEIALFLCSGTAADTVMPTFSASYICDATRYIQIQAATGQEHGGKYNTNVYRLEVTTTSGASGTTINPTTLMHIKWIGIQFRWFINTGGAGSTSNFFNCGSVSAGSRWDMQKCIIKFAHGTAAGSIRFIASNDADWTYRISNCLCYDFDIDGNNQTGFFVAITPGPHYIYNCTFAVMARAFGGLTSAQSRIKNCLFYNLTNLITGTFHTASNNNASTGAETITNWGANSRSSQTFTFVDAASKDFHLAAGDAGAKGFGKDLTTDDSGVLNITDDIDYQARAAPYDIGMDQYVVSGGSSGTDITLRILA